MASIGRFDISVACDVLYFSSIIPCMRKNTSLSSINVNRWSIISPILIVEYQVSHSGWVLIILYISFNISCLVIVCNEYINRCYSLRSQLSLRKSRNTCRHSFSSSLWETHQDFNNHSETLVLGYCCFCGTMWERSCLSLSLITTV